MSVSAPTLPGRGPTLVLDAATLRLQAGILEAGQWRAFRVEEGEALEAISTATEAVLAEAGLTYGDLRSIALGVGPGSILGLRLAVMAVETWRRLPELGNPEVFTFRGLELVARIEAQRHPTASFCLLSDFRKGTWHGLEVKAGEVGNLRLLSEDDLHQTANGALPLRFVPTGRGEEPPNTLPWEPLPYDLADLPSLQSPWATPTETIELYLPAPPVFKRWTPVPHTKPSSLSSS